MSDTVKIVDNDQFNEEDLYPDYNGQNIGGPNVNESCDDNSFESDDGEYGRYPTPDPADFGRPIRVSKLRWYILAVFSLLGVWQVILNFPHCTVEFKIPYLTYTRRNCILP